MTHYNAKTKTLSLDFYHGGFGSPSQSRSVNQSINPVNLSRFDPTSDSRSLFEGRLDYVEIVVRSGNSRRDDVASMESLGRNLNLHCSKIKGILLRVGATYDPQLIEAFLRVVDIRPLEMFFFHVHNHLMGDLKQKVTQFLHRHSKTLTRVDLSWIIDDDEDNDLPHYRLVRGREDRREGLRGVLHALSSCPKLESLVLSRLNLNTGDQYSHNDERNLNEVEALAEVIRSKPLRELGLNYVRLSPEGKSAIVGAVRSCHPTLRSLILRRGFMQNDSGLCNDLVDMLDQGRILSVNRLVLEGVTPAWIQYFSSPVIQELDLRCIYAEGDHVLNLEGLVERCPALTTLAVDLNVGVMARLDWLDEAMGEKLGSRVLVRHPRLQKLTFFPITNAFVRGLSRHLGAMTGIQHLALRGRTGALPMDLSPLLQGLVANRSLTKVEIPFDKGMSNSTKEIWSEFVTEFNDDAAFYLTRNLVKLDHLIRQDPSLATWSLILGKMADSNWPDHILSVLRNKPELVAQSSFSTKLQGHKTVVGTTDC